MQKADPEDKSGAYVTATAVTTRTATTHEDLGKNAKTQQLEEKTVATTTTHNLNRQEQRVVTQEVKTTATVTSGEQVGAAYAKPKPSQAKENMYSSNQNWYNVQLVPFPVFHCWIFISYVLPEIACILISFEFLLMFLAIVFVVIL